MNQKYSLSKTSTIVLIKVGLLNFLLAISVIATCQDYVVRDIKSFGAIGNGQKNDHEAFLKAARFFNARGGNGKLIIPRGTYLVGKQIVTAGKSGRFNWEGEDVLSFEGVTNLTIEGNSGSIIRYSNKLRFGSFDPKTGIARKGRGLFVDPNYAASIGHCINIENSNTVIIKGIELDGNSMNLTLGGTFGDKDWQLHHYGIMIRDSRKVTVQSVNVHHFGLDGIYVGNKKNNALDAIKLLDSKFNYNSRQGLSWGGGNDLTAVRCQFNHTGKGKFSSAPGAGVDIEAEYAPIRNGVFDNCEFIDATGCCLLAEAGDIRNVKFKECTFWSSTTWSIWTTKPAFLFDNCKIFGPVVHGYDAQNDQDATVFQNCYFEDKPYNGKHPSEPFMIDTNHKKRMKFQNCTIVANYKKLFWINGNETLKPDEKYQLINCRFKLNHAKFPEKSYYGVLRGVNMQGSSIDLINDAKNKKYYLER